MSIETVGWFAGLLLLGLGFGVGWFARERYEHRKKTMIVQPVPPPLPSPQPLPEGAFAPPWPGDRQRMAQVRNQVQATERGITAVPRPPQQPPQVARTAPPPATVPPGRPQLRMPDQPHRHRLQPKQTKPCPNAHEDNTRSRVSPIGRRWEPDTKHTAALPVVQPAEEGT